MTSKLQFGKRFVCSKCAEEITDGQAMLVHINKLGIWTKRWHFDCYKN